MGHDDEGETIETTYDLQEVVDRVEFLPEGHKKHHTWSSRLGNE